MAGIGLRHELSPEPGGAACHAVLHPTYPCAMLGSGWGKSGGSDGLARRHSKDHSDEWRTGRSAGKTRARTSASARRKAEPEHVADGEGAAGAARDLCREESAHGTVCKGSTDLAVG